MKNKNEIAKKLNREYEHKRLIVDLNQCELYIADSNPNQYYYDTEDEKTLVEFTSNNIFFEDVYRESVDIFQDCESVSFEDNLQEIWTWVKNEKYMFENIKDFKEQLEYFFIKKIKEKLHKL